MPTRGIKKTYHDEDCPKCGFPETVIVREEKTMKPLYIECSLRKCDWAKKMIEGVDFGKGKNEKRSN